MLFSEKGRDIETYGHRDDGDAMVQAWNGDIQLQAKGHQEVPAATKSSEQILSLQEQPAGTPYPSELGEDKFLLFQATQFAVN